MIDATKRRRQEVAQEILANWMEQIEVESIAFSKAVEPIFDDLIQSLFGLGKGLKKDHLYSVMRDQEVHKAFLMRHIGRDKVLSLTGNHKERGRILAVSELTRAINGFSYIETGQPFRNKPEKEKIAHHAYTISTSESMNSVSVRGKLLNRLITELCREISPVLTTISKDHGVRILGHKKYTPNDQLIAIMLVLEKDYKKYQVELRVQPITETLGPLEADVLNHLFP